MIKGVIESRTCLLPMITPRTRFLLRMYAHYKNGLLPMGGGVLEQPNYFAEAMEILSERDSLILAEKVDQARRNAGAQGHG